MADVLTSIPPLINKKESRIAAVVQNYRKHKMAYWMLIPGIIYFVIFNYIPMGGLVIAFQNFKGALGLLKSPWVGLQHFRILFNSPDFYQIFRNTLLINFYKLLFYFPIPVIWALLINEIRNRHIKKYIQTIIYFPHFLSWIVIGGIIFKLLGNDGVFNMWRNNLGLERINFLSSTKYFRSILVISAIWKEAGWGTILYLATLCGIDPSLYEAAYVDGANRWRQTLHISIPCLSGTIAVLLILRIGSMMTIGFEQIFVLYNPLVYEVGDVFGTYIYRTGLLTGRFSYSTAVGMFQSVVALILIYTSNKMANRLGDKGIW